MYKHSRWLTLWLSAASAAWVLPAVAEPCSALSRANLARCALSASLERRAGEAAVRAANGKIEATEPWLPSNPALEISGSRRRGAGESTLNWSASLGLELEVAGQRGARRETAMAERDGQRSAVDAIDRATVAEAFRQYFEVLSARQATHVLERLEAASTKVWQAAQAAAERGAAAGIEADVMDAARVSVQRRTLDARRDERLASASLANLIGITSTQPLEVSGTLEPLLAAANVQASLAPPDSPEVKSFSAERRAALLRATALRRSRVPNPTLSVFVQRDGFDESVVGVGLALPLPLPEPLGRTSAGAIAENEALAERAALLSANGRRNMRVELVRAVTAYQAARDAVRFFDEQRLARAELTLSNLASELQAGRVPIRDAIVFQEPLLELLLGAIEARKELCLASIEVVRAAGLPLDGSRS